MGNTKTQDAITIDAIKFILVPFFISEIRYETEQYANGTYVHLKNPLKKEYTGSKRMSGFLHFYKLTIKSISKIIPNKHKVHESANPNSQTIYPKLQNVKKLGMNLDQLSSNRFPKVEYVGASAIENKRIIWQWSRNLLYCLKIKTLGTTSTRPTIEKAKPTC